MATQRTTQISLEALRANPNQARTTQISLEALRADPNQNRVTQVSVEVLVERLIVTPEFEGWGMAI